MIAISLQLFNPSRHLPWLFFSTLIWSCTPSLHDRIEENATLFFKGKSLSKLQTNTALEASGMVFSKKNPEHFWTHNDSGGKTELYLFSLDGNLDLTISLSGIKNIDWEDLAIDQNNGHLFIADIGDNRGVRKKVSIYRIKEPVWDGKSSNLEITDINKMTVKYENGARDAETLMFDPSTDGLLIVTKREQSCFVYSFPFTTKEKVVKIAPASRIDITSFTAGDINSKGEILIKTYKEIFYWEDRQQNAGQALLEEPDWRIPYLIEPQGEAIGWDLNGNFFTLSEKPKNRPQRLYFYERK